MPRVQYRIYVVELSKRVFTENAKFRAANPQFNGVLECLYVGMTSKTPKERFLQHKTGYRNKKGYKLSRILLNVFLGVVGLFIALVAQYTGSIPFYLKLLVFPMAVIIGWHVINRVFTKLC